ncbi:uncharacterized protein BDR25DRAFT_48132 [Lindgomyces ingoldianus]|uniref:Uncharacterized protein n=1 Tax=Lindgomyces ingoldianus TaxID=673940 RepID=A0ACB6QQM0_9PLEO|nr:uncharacterized protein BDR25DRAFT_48132 [Lindgomyces ingoldianus]KAF2469309.1 hypothetical protein BDR25DRAFT_48132 [Lindgomyces ingoldianus]
MDGGLQVVTIHGCALLHSPLLLHTYPTCEALSPLTLASSPRSPQCTHTHTHTKLEGFVRNSGFTHSPPSPAGRADCQQRARRSQDRACQSIEIWTCSRFAAKDD